MFLKTYPILYLEDFKGNLSLLAFTRNILGVLLLFFFPISTTLTTLIAIAFIPIALTTFNPKDFLISLRNPRSLAILAFIAVNLISLFYTNGDTKDILLTLKKYSKFLLIPLLMPVFNEVRWQHFGVISFLSSLSITVLYYYINFFFLHSHFYFKDRIYTSSLTAFGIFILFWYIIESKISSFAKLSLFILSMVLLYYLFFINTGRTGQVIFPFLMCVLFYHYFNKKIFSAALVSIFLFIPLVLYKFEKPKLESTAFYTIAINTMRDLPIYTRFKDVYYETKDYLIHYSLNNPSLQKGKSTSIRLEFYLNTLLLILKKPVLGYGIGSFPSMYNTQYPERSKEGKFISQPHNQYLLTFVELGLPGIATLSFIFLSLFFYQSQMSIFDKLLSMGLFYFMTVGCLLNSWLLDSTSGYFFICFFALIGGKMLNKVCKKGFTT